jgi:hypothetical protein
MTSYEISKQIRIHHIEDDWSYVITTDEYGTVVVTAGFDSIHIPRDCLQHFIDALSQV